MSVADKIISIKSHIQAAYDAVEEMGGEIPAQKNLANLALAVEGIVTGPDPDNPTLENLKIALKTGHPEKYYPVGTKILDKQSAWTIASFETAIAEDDRSVFGAYLMQSVTSALVMNYSGLYNPYSDSKLQTYLEGSDFLDTLSDTLKSLATTIKIASYQMRTQELLSIPAKFFAPSRAELNMTELAIYAPPVEEGSAWQFFSNANYSDAEIRENRIVRNTSNAPIIYWTRTGSSRNRGNTYSFFVNRDGSPGDTTCANSTQITPVAACFIAKD